MKNILIGILLIIIGFLIVWKSRKFIDFFGTIDWAEVKLGGGGTNLMYKLVGIISILVGFIWATGMWNAFLNATLGGILFPGQRNM